MARTKQARQKPSPRHIGPSLRARRMTSSCARPNPLFDQQFELVVHNTPESDLCDKWASHFYEHMRTGMNPSLYAAIEVRDRAYQDTFQPMIDILRKEQDSVYERLVALHQEIQEAQQELKKAQQDLAHLREANDSPQVPKRSHSAACCGPQPSCLSPVTSPA
ncbi:hypothetical protein H4582DRAFT_2084327 [Lactarius indigo]|nr:hypothetical protein H4582DRAFT_2084327 [Lactarius indigo]